jgi:fermentation-respiration switch protein FrsA (DUF1100 family)
MLRRVAMTALLALAFTYAGLLAMLKLSEDRLVFPVAPWSGGLAAPRAGLEPVRVEVTTADSIRLVGWRMGNPEDTAGRWLLMFHGNGGDISHGGRQEHYAALRALGLNLLTFDYRGYGESDGEPSEAGIYRDADAAYGYLRDSLGVAPDRLLIFGHSLGTAVAVDLASRVPSRGLILEGALTSVPDVGQRTYFFVPVRLMARNRFASAEKIERVTVPKLFLHATADEVIPYDFGRRLFELAPGPKRFVPLAGGHNDAYSADSATYFGGVAAFLGELEP